MRTKTALVELLKENRDLRTLFKRCCKAGSFRLRSQGWQFREELANRDYGAALDEVQDALFELACHLFPESPAADFTAWAELLCKDTLARLQEHYSDFSPEEKEAVDLSVAWARNDEIVAACEAEDLGTLRDALRSYEREALDALEATRKASGAA